MISLLPSGTSLGVPLDKLALAIRARFAACAAGVNILMSVLAASDSSNGVVERISTSLPPDRPQNGDDTLIPGNPSALELNNELLSEELNVLERLALSKLDSELVSILGLGSAILSNTDASSFTS